MKDRLKECVYIVAILVLICTLAISVYVTKEVYTELQNISKSYGCLQETQRDYDRFLEV